LICNENGHRILKTCICISQQVNEECSAYLELTISKLQELLIKDLSKTLFTKCSYILIAILENTNHKDSIIEAIKRSGINLEKAVGNKIYESIL
jgi:hypothetical protein